MINIHNLISLDIDKAFPWRDDWLSILGDLPKQEIDNGPLPNARIKLVYDQNISLDTMRDIGEGLYIRKNAVYDKKYRLLLARDVEGALLLRTDNPCVEWMFWALQLSLLSVGATLVHGAGVEKDGKATLFASWGGVGKTVLIAGYIKDQNWKLLGDDWIILSADGSCYSFPKPMVLYPYHKSVFPEVFTNGKGPVAPVSMNAALSKIAIKVKPLLRLCPNLLQFARRHNPQSVRVNPSEVFGMSNISSSSKLDQVIWLDRIAGIEAPELHFDDGTLASRMMGCTIRESDARCGEVLSVAMGLGIIDSESFYSGWISTLQEATRSCRKHIMYLPADMHVSEVSDAVTHLFEQQKVLSD